VTQAHIVSASRPDAEWVADLIGDSFQHLSVTEWLLPDPAERAKVLPRNFQIYVEHACEYGLVHVFADRSAAAVWVPRGLGEVPPPHDYDRRLAEVCGAATERFQHLDELFDANHPHEPHHHLAFLGVGPVHQGSGLGSRLLEHHHATLDRENIAGFLEASSTGSRDLYLRKGYRQLGEPYAVPNGALFWPMWREPRQSSSD
jgi:ribosomal protein S18 acetylase RimI-like enzyme